MAKMKSSGDPKAVGIASFATAVVSAEAKVTEIKVGWGWVGELHPLGL